MAKRGYKLQEFVAHSGNVNCLRIGRKNFRQFITGGDDQVVNLWSIGNPAPLSSLSGHSSPVESVAFDSSEILVVAGASSGVIKLWDLEETKMVRTLSGHRSYCTAVEFHPFGEFFASGSMDTNLKIWDIRKKGCIHTYKGHTRGISTIRFTPDGRWVVSGGFDNVVKIWDLTAGKLLHDFKFHEGHIRSIDFHPLEFLLATGSADRTVKFWDLETFEMIGSARRETAGVRSITFHPDGRTLFCGLDDSLKVYSWEPVICHDSVDMGWSTLGDMCVHDGKLLGGAYFQNSVGVWVADISLIEPYGGGAIPELNGPPEQKYEVQENPSEKSVSHRRSNSNFRSMSPDIDSKDIKNIYVDTEACKPVTSTKVGSLNSPNAVDPSEPKEITTLASQKQGSAVRVHAKTNVSGDAKSFIVPIVIPREYPSAKDKAGSRRESFASSRAITGTLKPSHIRRSSNTKSDMEKISTGLETMSLGSMTTAVETKTEPNFNSKLVCNNNVKEFSEGEDLSIKNVGEKLEKATSLTRLSNQENGEKPQECNKGVIPIRVVNGVAVVRGRTRSLVERFEKREGLSSNEAQTPEKAPNFSSEEAQTPEKAPNFSSKEAQMPENAPNFSSKEAQMPDRCPSSITEAAKASLQDNNPPNAGREPDTDDNHAIEALMQNHDVLLSTFRSRLTKLQVVRHFWERNDVKGAINAMMKLPDHSVQADVVSVLKEKMEIITLELFSCLLPVLLSLLDSKIDRHASVSLEMLLKLIAVFGPLVHSTVSAPRAVGVDLHAEERRESCKQCFVHLQNVQKILPSLIQIVSLLLIKF
nr:katanin p80 WD40 repeat-containing subunit B1 homolog isoform X3 [Coffea arabica]